MIKRARDAGVNRIIVTGGSLSESKEALALARKHEGIFCTVGVHPTRCSEFPKEEMEEYFNNLKTVAEDGMTDGKVVAIGTN
jgi:TatD DNase family protein